MGLLSRDSWVHINASNVNVEISRDCMYVCVLQVDIYVFIDVCVCINNNINSNRQHLYSRAILSAF